MSKEVELTNSDKTATPITARNDKGQFIRGATKYPDGRPKCVIEECVRDGQGADVLCTVHSQRKARLGDPEARLRRPKGSALARFNHWTDQNGPIKKEELGRCWVWQGKPDHRGYGRFADDSGWYDMAHRWSYKHFIGEIPSGYVVDHRCEYPSCVRPQHLEAIPAKTNVIDRGIGNAAFLNSQKTQCKRGHEFVEGSYYTQKNGSRTCKACHKIRVQEYKERLITGKRATGTHINKSGFHGVTVNDNQNGKLTYLASTTHEGHQIYIGVFDNAEEAGRAYDAKAIELYGVRFPFFNFPDELGLEDVA